MVRIAPILLILLNAPPALANVAFPIIEGDPGAERARLANSYLVPAFGLGIIAMYLFWNWVQRRTGSSLGCAVGGTITAAYLLGAFAITGMSGPVAFHPAPVPGGPMPMIGYDRNNRPWTKDEVALAGLALSFVISLGGFLLLHSLQKLISSAGPTSGPPATQL